MLTKSVQATLTCKEIENRQILVMTWPSERTKERGVEDPRNSSDSHTRFTARHDRNLQQEAHDCSHRSSGRVRNFILFIMILSSFAYSKLQFITCEVIMLPGPQSERLCFSLTVLVIILESRHLSEYPAHDGKDDDVHDQHPVLKEYLWLNLMLTYRSIHEKLIQ